MVKTAKQKIIEELQEKYVLSFKEAKYLYELQFKWAREKMEDAEHNRIALHKLGTFKKTNKDD